MIPQHKGPAWDGQLQRKTTKHTNNISPEVKYMYLSPLWVAVTLPQSLY